MWIKVDQIDVLERPSEMKETIVHSFQMALLVTLLPVCRWLRAAQWYLSPRADLDHAGARAAPMPVLL